MAYVRPAAGAAPAADALLSVARAWLPEQAVPSAVRIVDGFPLDANGKVDRAELLRRESAQDIGSGAAATDGAGSDEATAGERLVLGTVRDLLARPQTTLADNFTAVGGTSLAAARLLAAIQRESGCGCAPRTAAPGRPAGGGGPGRRPARGPDVRGA
ncbi:phosphopantetheine-binding protein [Streptomyces lydicus]|nr:phosphopantetheine-binding protein [Streptomyces lydicus]